MFKHEEEMAPFLPFLRTSNRCEKQNNFFASTRCSLKRSRTVCLCVCVSLRLIVCARLQNSKRANYFISTQGDTVTKV